MVGLCCAYCPECIPEQEQVDLMDHAVKRFCVHQHKMRPGMEACGIDVFITVRNAGYEVEVLKSPYTYRGITFFGLLLLE